jgi:hypothetical protein
MKNQRSLIWIVVLIVLFASGCWDPQDRRPGLFLSGTVEEEAVSDWSFSDEFQEIYLETRTWYLVRHSVTTVCARVGAKLYVPSLYYAGGEWPNKFWNSNVESDPRVRLGIGGKLYAGEAHVVKDPAESRAAIQALAAKYPFWRELVSKPENERPDMAIVRVDSRTP